MPQGTTIHSVFVCADMDTLVVVVAISGRQCCCSIVDWGNGRTTNRTMSSVINAYMVMSSMSWH